MMSLLSFGEIDFPYSRAFWDDYDGDEPPKHVPERLQLSYELGQPKEPISSELMVVVEGKHIRHFAELVLSENSTKICSVSSGSSSIQLKKDHDVLIAIIEEDLNISGEVTTLLQPYANLSRKVITITIKPKIDYKSENIDIVRDEITFIRGINAEVDGVVPLEPPNFIAGVAAGIASWREGKKLPTNCYIAYTDNTKMDALAAQPITNLFRKLGLNCAENYSPDLTGDCLLYS